jgi:hypothetical protein
MGVTTAGTVSARDQASDRKAQRQKKKKGNLKLFSQNRSKIKTSGIFMPSVDVDKYLYLIIDTYTFQPLVAVGPVQDH